MTRTRFRQPEKITEAVQFDGDWHALVAELGWTMKQLVERWPRVNMSFDKNGNALYTHADGQMQDTPYQIEAGCWVIVDGDAIVGIATENAFDNQERIDQPTKGQQ